MAEHLPSHQFAARIAQVTKKVHYAGKKRDHLVEAKWYVAWHIAAEMQDCYTIKDWAHAILDGIPALTEDEIKEFLDEDQPTDNDLLHWFT